MTPEVKNTMSKLNSTFDSADRRVMHKERRGR
jgi:hypothetical protein